MYQKAQRSNQSDQNEADRQNMADYFVGQQHQVFPSN
jgi:hypothetical protein